MRRKVIMIDMDGVIADFDAGFSALAVKYGYLDRVIPSAEKVSYGWEQYLDGQQRSTLWKEVLASGKYWLELPTLLDTTEALALAQMEKDYDIYFVTARLGHRCKQQTEIYLARMGVYCPTVVVLDGRTGGPSPQAHLFKRAVATAIGASWSIDDNERIVREVGWITGIQSYLRLHNYNKDSTCENQIDSLGGFLQKVWEAA